MRSGTSTRENVVGSKWFSEFKLPKSLTCSKGGTLKYILGLNFTNTFIHSY